MAQAMGSVRGQVGVCADSGVRMGSLWLIDRACLHQEQESVSRQRLFHRPI